MKDLFQHVEHLMTEHDCVVVPGLGGFVLHDAESRVDEAGEIFHPKGKDITFNSRLTFNDGILVQSYMEDEDLSFEAAVERIHEAVAELQEQLDEGRVLAFGRLGTLLKNAEGKLTFRPDNHNLYCPDAYGLSPFVFPTLAQRRHTTVVEQERAEKRKRERARREPRTIRRITFGQVLTGAAACLLMLLISKPVGQLKGYEAQEAFLLHKYVDAAQRRHALMAPPVAATGLNTLPTLKDTFIPDKESSTSLSLVPSRGGVTPAAATSEQASAGTAATTDYKPKHRKDVPSTDDIDSLFGIVKPTDNPTTGAAPKSTFYIQPDDGVRGPSAASWFTYRSLQPVVPIDQQAATSHTEQPASPSAEAAPALEPVKAVLEEKLVQTAEVTTVPSADTPTKRYYIVISSHASKETANEWLTRNRKGLYKDADLVEGNDRVRIYLRSFTDKEAAQAFLETLRAEHPQHKDAWLLAKRS